MIIETNGGGVSGFEVAEEEEPPLSGTGGASGGGTRAGEGEPSGEGASRDRPAGRSAPSPGEDRTGHEADALERADHDADPALEYGEGDRPTGATIGEALGSGAGNDVGSGADPSADALGGAGIERSAVGSAREDEPL